MDCHLITYVVSVNCQYQFFLVVIVIIIIVPFLILILSYTKLWNDYQNNTILLPIYPRTSEMIVRTRRVEISESIRSSAAAFYPLIVVQEGSTGFEVHLDISSSQYQVAVIKVLGQSTEFQWFAIVCWKIHRMLARMEARHLYKDTDLERAPKYTDAKNQF